MKFSIGFLAFAFLTLVFNMPASAARNDSFRESAALQATMQQFVDQKTVDGAYLIFDAENERVRELYPSTAHPVIFQLDEHFVLCFHFVDAGGQKVEVDYYVARKGDGFVVFHESLSRDALKAMMREGRVKPLH